MDGFQYILDISEVKVYGMEKKNCGTQFYLNSTARWLK